MNPYGQTPLSEAKEDLLSNAMQRKWKEVIKIYKRDKTAHEAKITRSGDTALHMAISDEREDIVEELVTIIVKEKKEALGIKNDLGNTPLHLAAYIGKRDMCNCIAREDHTLMAKRNNNTETPFYLSVVYGRREAFLFMHDLCKNNVRQAYANGRKKDGNTILHAAISEEHFDLAYQIIHLYPKLPTQVNERGLKPLHILAGKPSAFRSGSRMNVLRGLIYDRVIVSKLKFPENSPTSSGVPNQGQTTEQIDAENPKAEQLVHEKAMVPENRSTCFNGLKLMFRVMGMLLGLEFSHKGKIREEKKKHTWSVQIMEKLIEKEYEAGSISDLLSPNKGGEGIEFDPKILNASKFVDRDDHSPHPKPRNGTDGNGKKDRAPFPTKEGVTEMVEKIFQTFGVAKNTDEKKKDKASMANDKKETALLIAAKHGILEMVEKILEKFPMTIHDENGDGKNIALLAVENRQPHVYKFLLNQKMFKDTIFYKRDNDGNTALHIAAMLGNKKNWLIPGPALQMQWEIKWYQFVENSAPARFFALFARHNIKGKTPWEIFTESHKDLVKEAADWLYKTSESCSVVAILIATVAFTASATVPGGINSSDGSPVLAKQPGFTVFAVASLVALCFSIASVVMFMVFFTSRYHEKDFGTDLPSKLLVELTSLLISIAAVLVSFCAAHFFVIRDSFKYTAVLLYAATLLPVAFYATWQIPVYIKLAVATWKKDPERIYSHD